MSEGGLFAWKRQHVDHGRGPAGSYHNLRRPLPEPPKDMHWIQDLDTHEWHLTKIVPALGDEKEAFGIQDASTIPGMIEHKVLPTDTFQGICLKYKITPTELRRANGGFSGTNLYLVPNPLQIPINSQYLQQKQMASTTTSGRITPAQKIRQLQLGFAPSSLSTSEAKCYLELNDWDVDKAMENARDDGFC
mmetsp:Transcript_68709/g.192666  ORF Transcript_68709/g.192666 Transcript_68709/m.192666 type:complete len:191 (+) Transcript_68709:95-667(+)|eukprot:CAMPEP_0176236920 /NCGR_PEP_ID=MMETSP0121_2-20121125/27586_1 /TAXON_ID=160619 /ORGANISM="Kryptoperidinium foliaceum, Strain CCMP 1326" /LENGTH=190 /DNA_ID=CAMNT_0017576355 /DNA_START=82 /DNA_END=654 /DNA_ORIENTATION=-